MTTSEMRRIRDLLIRSIPREVAVSIGLRVLSPGPSEGWPYHPDAGGIAPPDKGVFRPVWLQQDPAADPTEPYGGESSDKGHDHGWANCNMTAAAVTWCYHKHRTSGPWGGDMRHHQDDLSGGTDLWDAQVAWDRYGGQWLDIRAGEGWDALKKARKEGRAILVQGSGKSPGNNSFTGNHASVIGCEIHEKTGNWLFGDPLAADWQYCAPADIRAWMEGLGTGLYYAVTKPVPGTETLPDDGGGNGGDPDPDPDPEPCDPCAAMDALSAQIAQLSAEIKAGAAG